MQIKIPKNVEKIINTLEAAGFEAYAVGGCVRDTLLDREPNDWDITTSASPEETKALFKRTFDTGIKHGTVSVLMDKVIYEVTTYRIDGEYADSRHPDKVTFTDKLSEDLLRRDFTINAMAYNPVRGLVDLYGGREDLKQGIIRCVGNPSDRFSEDALRILRALRFSAQLGYDIEEQTKLAIKELAPTLSKISAERIRVELEKLLISDHPETIRLAYELGVTKVILPEFDEMMVTPQNHPHHSYSVGEHTIVVMQNIRNDRILRLAALFHDIGKPGTRTTDEDGIDHFKGHPELGAKKTENIMRRLKYDNDSIARVSRFVKAHDWTINARLDRIRHYVNRIGEDCFPEIFELNLADILGQSDFLKDEKIQTLDAFKAAYFEMIKNKECVSLRTLAVTGKDLIEAGIKPGPEVGEILSKLLNAVLDDPSLNTKEQLMKMI